jgi:hypothetical protein
MVVQKQIHFPYTFRTQLMINFKTHCRIDNFRNVLNLMVFVNCTKNGVQI